MSPYPDQPAYRVAEARLFVEHIPQKEYLVETHLTADTFVNLSNGTVEHITLWTELMLNSKRLRISPALSICLVLASVSGCQTSHIMVGQARPPISPEQVQIYLHPPARYEEIALLDTSSKNSFSFTAQGKTNAVMERLKGEAAKLGANGILLSGVGDQASGSVGTGFGSATSRGNTSIGLGFGSSSTVFQKKGDGLAIYVEPDKVASR